MVFGGGGGVCDAMCLCVTLLPLRYHLQNNVKNYSDTYHISHDLTPIYYGLRKSQMLRLFMHCVGEGWVWLSSCVKINCYNDPT